MRVLDRVRQGFLDHAVDGRTGPGVRGGPFASHLQFDRLAGAPNSLDQVAHLVRGRVEVPFHREGSAGGVRGVGEVRVLEHVEKSTQIGHRLAPAVADTCHQIGVPVGGQEPGGVGLHHHGGDVVGDHVVQVPCDPGALAGSGRLDAATVPFGLARSPRAHQRTGPGAGEHDEVEGGIVGDALGRPACVQCQGEDQIAGRQRRRRGGPEAVLVGAGAVERDDDADAGERRRVGEQLDRGEAQGHEGEAGEGVQTAHDQG